MNTTSMALLGDSVLVGLDVIRSRFGENAYRFVMRFARWKKINPSTSKKLNTFGILCGLNAQEIKNISKGPTSTTRFPRWLMVGLIVVAYIAAIWVAVVWANGLYIPSAANWTDGNGLYIPGTLYASISPNDFENSLVLQSKDS